MKTKFEVRLADGRYWVDFDQLIQFFRQTQKDEPDENFTKMASAVAKMLSFLKEDVISNAKVMAAETWDGPQYPVLRD